MVIRKLFRFEAAHMVRNCTSAKCRDNIHGHSYIVEVFITSNRLDDGCMVMDFSRLAPVKEFIGSFDHSYILWKKEDPAVTKMIHAINRRVVELPVSPSSEGLALSFFMVIDRIVDRMERKNGEGKVTLQSVRVHETATGYAEAFREDLDLVCFDPEDISFSQDIRQEWKDDSWWKRLQAGKP